MTVVGDDVDGDIYNDYKERTFPYLLTLKKAPPTSHVWGGIVSNDCRKLDYHNTYLYILLLVKGDKYLYYFTTDE